MTLTDAAAPGVSVAFLESFCDAFNRRDLDALLGHMADDCLFLASAGPDEEGRRWSGQDGVRAGFAEVFATFPDGQWEGIRHVVFGDRGLSEWVFRGTRSDGVRVETNGIDVFTFRNGKIAVKDSYRKQRSW